MLDRREALLKDKLAAATERLALAEGTYEAVQAELAHVYSVRSATAGDYLTYVVRGQPGGGHVIGIEGDTFILMSGPLEARKIVRVNARFIVGVNSEKPTA